MTMNFFVKVDNKPRKDHGYPTGLMDIVTIKKKNFKIF